MVYNRNRIFVHSFLHTTIQGSVCTTIQGSIEALSYCISLVHVGPLILANCTGLVDPARRRSGNRVMRAGALAPEVSRQLSDRNQHTSVRLPLGGSRRCRG